MLNNENLKNGAKVIGSFAKDLLEVVAPFVVLGLIGGKKPVTKHIVTYSDAISAILHSSMLGSDKAELTSKLPMDMKPEVYKAVIEITKSSMLGSDKRETILKLCDLAEES